MTRADFPFLGCIELQFQIRTVPDLLGHSPMNLTRKSFDRISVTHASMASRLLLNIE
jgi:hypothetical protein